MILWFWWGRSSISNVSKRAILKSLQYLKKEVRDEVDSLHPDKLWVSKLSTRWSLLMDMIKHFQSTQSKDIYPYIISKKILSMVIILRLFVSEKKKLKQKMLFSYTFQFVFTTYPLIGLCFLFLLRIPFSIKNCRFSHLEVAYVKSFLVVLIIDFPWYNYIQSYIQS